MCKKYIISEPDVTYYTVPGYVYVYDTPVFKLKKKPANDSNRTKIIKKILSIKNLFSST